MEIRSYQHNDEKQILELFKLVFKKDLSAKYWNWRFLENPAYEKPMIYLMWDGSVLAGHYAVSPVKMKFESEVKMTALSMTTMTHPEYGGRGIFSDLASGLYKDISENSGVSMVWGFPNNNSHYGFVKNLKWSDKEVIPSLTINPSLLKRKSSFQFNKIESFTVQHENSANQLIADLGFNCHVLKSQEYLNWRFVSNPMADYTTLEIEVASNRYFITTKIFKTAVDFQVDVVEFALPFDMEMIQSALIEVISYYEAVNGVIAKINLWIPLQDKRRILLEKLGFIMDAPLTYLGRRVFDNEYTNQSWYYSMSDSDVY